MSLVRVGVQCRAEMRKGGKVGGYAAVFGEVADLGPFGKEALAEGAFDVALKGSDVRALWEHDPTRVLGRESVGTLRLRVDSTGLEWEADLPDTGYARDLAALVERGDIDGASFGFVPGQQSYDTERQVRTHTSVKRLVDVSAVTWGAYNAATTEARSASFRATRLRSQLIRARARAHLEGVRS